MTRMYGACAALLLSLPCAADAAEASWWPPALRWGDTRIALTGHYNYDFNHSGSGDDTHSEQTLRRKELGFRVMAKDRWDSFVYFDFQTHRWLDVTLAVQTRWLFGTDFGRFRIGHARVPFGFETLDPSRNRSFMEMALPMQAFYHNRRTGIDWQIERKHYLFNLAYYLRGDMQGDNDGHTTAAHAAWMPRNTPGHVVHLGTSFSIDHPRTQVDGLGQRRIPTARFQTAPEAGLTPTRLVDTGTLDQVHSVHRQGIEAAWIEGRYSLQGEAVRTRVLRNQRADFSGQGYYVFGSVILTGESRGYAHGQAANVMPRRRWGALELLARYSAIDLDDGLVRGGREHDITFGANWYLSRYVKYQFNQVFAHATRRGIERNDRILEMRLQLQF